MKKYRNFLAAVISLLAVYGMYLNGEALAEENGSSQQPITLEYWIWDDEEYYIRKIVESFEMTHPGIDINLHVMENY